MRVKLKYYSKFIPVVVTTVCILVISMIAFKIISYGFLPCDDALAHAAKVISGKDLNQIMVIRPDVKLDPNAGWRAILELVHYVTGWDVLGLVLFSVVSLFILYSLVGISSLRRPEAWPIMLLILTLAWGAPVGRLIEGRPYIVTMTTMLFICFAWPRLTEKKPPYDILSLLALSIASSTWIHCSWYIFGLPVIALLLARQPLASARLAAAAACGVILGAVMTGHPVTFLTHTVRHPFLVFGNIRFQNMLVGELLPGDGSVVLVIAVLLLMAWRALRGRWDSKVIDNPVFILGSLCWVLGFMTMRVWLDIGIPALSFWVANEIQDFLETGMGPLSAKRLVVAFMALGTLYFAVTSDINFRWSGSIFRESMTANNPEQKDLLPDPGGILYSTDMLVYFRTFFKNPRAEWRYMVGSEPAIMPPEDLKIFRDLQFHFGDIAYFKPWVDKMKPEDRLIIQYGPDKPPPLEGLKWSKITGTQWSGRLPRKGDPPIDGAKKTT